MTRLFAHPEPIQVIAGPDGVPQGIYWGGRWRTVEHVANRWRVTSSWWIQEAAAEREYVKLVTADGLVCTVYRDMTNDAWYMDRIND
jgi:hypothetical protein